MTVRQVNDLLFLDKDDLEGAKGALSIPALSHSANRVPGSQQLAWISRNSSPSCNIRAQPGP